MQDMTGPPGFQHIETAPKDGTWLRFRFRRVEFEKDVVGRWEPHSEMKTGGSWFDRDGCYITPGPLFWALSKAEKCLCRDFCRENTDETGRICRHPLSNGDRQ